MGNHQSFKCSNCTRGADDDVLPRRRSRRRRSPSKSRNRSPSSSEGYSLKETIASDLVQHHIVQDISHFYTWDKSHQLGQGAFGYVTRATNVQSGKEWAIKVVNIHNDVDREALRNEIDLLKKLHHPNIVRVLSSYEDPGHMYMVMQLCHGRELFKHLYGESHRESGAHAFREDQVQELMRHVLLALVYLHSNQVCHRDLKLENLLLETAGDMSSVKICDLGLSKECREGESLSAALGTIDYVAPEVLFGEYTTKADLWSVGVLTYELLVGVSPFRDPLDEINGTKDGTMSRILDATLSFAEPRFAQLSPACLKFIKLCVRENPNERVSAETALRLAWMKPGSPNHLNLSSVETMVCQWRDFSQCVKMKQMAMLAVAFVIDEVKLGNVLRAFRALDTDQRGIIVFREFTSVVVAQTEFLTQDEARVVFNQLDQTQSNSITYLEFVAATVNRLDVDDQTLREAFRQLDPQLTGKISPEGLTSLVRRVYARQDVVDMLLTVDLTGDGCLNYEEFVTMFREDTDVTSGAGAMRLSKSRPQCERTTSTDSTTTGVGEIELLISGSSPSGNIFFNVRDVDQERKKTLVEELDTDV